MKFFDLEEYNWHKRQTLVSMNFKCGYCNFIVSSDKGYRIGKLSDGSGEQNGGIYICSNCHGPTFFTPFTHVQSPGCKFGEDVKNVPNELYTLYNEARQCFAINSYTAVSMLCRKMLMNIAVEKNADKRKTFIEYVNYLSDKGYIPPNGKEWVDHIRSKGNEANHEIKLMDINDAKELLIFVEMLLKFIYEFPSIIKKN